jgi:RNA polymerase sigma-70 factor (ECF subfamily)
MNTPDADSPDIVALLERAGAGDAAAVDALLARHREGVRRFIDLRLDPALRGRLDASDVLQEAQLEVARRLPDYLRRRPMPFRAWVCRTAHQSLLRLRRHHADAACRAVGREGRLPEQSSALLARRLQGHGPTPSQEVLRAERLERLQATLAGLPEADREVILLRTFEGLSNQEAAQVLGLEPDAASKRYARALVRLQKALAEAGLTESSG